jgi:hypothetical protein
MTSKEKALSLYEAMYYKTPKVLSEKRKDETAKSCALVCCAEIINYMQDAIYIRCSDG